MKTCFICLKEINEEERYIKISGIINKKEEKKKYMNASFWNLALEQRQAIKESMKLLNGVKGFMQQQGIIPEEVYNIQ